MSFFNDLFSVLYKYYSTGATRNIPFFQTLSVFVILSFLNVGSLFYFFGIDILIFINHSNKFIKYLYALLMTIPSYLLIYVLIDKDKVKKCRFDEKKYKIILMLFFSYFFLSMIIFMLSIRLYER